MNRRTLSILLLVLLGACDRSRPAPVFESSDSAGVRIVSNQASDAVTSVVQEWRIGVLDEPAEYQFSKVSAVIEHPSGLLFVANGANLTVRAYDQRHEFIRDIGRKGNGPGEFRSLDQLVVVADTLVVLDFQRGGRVSFFTLDGRYINGWPLRLEEDGVLPLSKPDSTWFGYRVDWHRGLFTAGVEYPHEAAVFRFVLGQLP